MKRSEINFEIKEAEAFFRSFGFRLPGFAGWTPEELRNHAGIDEIFDCKLGWDVTDFGHGDFRREGLLLFTLRNGIAGSAQYPKPYAEKIMISRSGQRTLMHCHEKKREDIINRGGGMLVFELFNRVPGEVRLAETPVTLSRDGERITVKPGEQLRLAPGESITLEPHVFHSFWGDGDVLIGEVSSVNDDLHDNVFFGEQIRFPAIDEDEPPYRLLVSDY